MRRRLCQQKASEEIYKKIKLGLAKRQKLWYS
jgi:hypothetical protein